jgi:predicted transcriptional regulator
MKKTRTFDEHFKRSITRPTRTLKVGIGSVDEHFKRSITRAKKLDRGEKVPAEWRITFEDPAEFLRAITAERIRIIQAVRTTPVDVTTLAAKLKRDRAAVNRDVKILTSLGLLTTDEESNPGHGLRKIIRPLASKYEFTI